MSRFTLQSADLAESELAYWLSQATPGDPAALQMLVERYAAGLCNLIHFLLSRQHAFPTSDEILLVAGQVFGTASLNPGEVRGWESVRAWLYSLALPAARYSPWVRLRALARPTPLTLPGFEHRPADLTERDAVMLFLRYACALTPGEIVQIYNTDMARLQKRLWKARERLLDSTSLSPHAEQRVLINNAHDGLIEHDADARQRLAAHLAGCPACQAYAAGIESVAKELAEHFGTIFPPADLSTEQLEQIAAAVRSASPSARSRRLGGRAREMALFAAVLVSVLLFGLYIAQQDTHRGRLFVLSTPGATVTPLPSASVPVYSVPETSDESNTYSGLYLSAESITYSDPDLSADGRWIVFQSFSFAAQYAAAGDVQMVTATSQVMLYDGQTGLVAPLEFSGESFQPGSDSSSPSISADGRWIAFDATPEINFAWMEAGEEFAPSCFEIFVHDRQTGVTRRITAGCGDAPGSGSSEFPRISDDGRWLAYWSSASQPNQPERGLCPPSSQLRACWNVFIHDLQTGRTQLVPLGRSEQKEAWVAREPLSLSADGRWLALTLHQDDAAALEPAYASQAFVYDLQSETYEPVDLAPDGSPGNGPSSNTVLSADGRYVAFASLADNLVPGDTNGKADVFVRDRQSNTIVRVSVSTAGEQGSADSGARGDGSLDAGATIAMSDDGRFLVFLSAAADLVADQAPPCTSDLSCVYAYIHDRRSGVTSRIAEQAQAGGFYYTPTISPKGEWGAIMQWDMDCGMRQTSCSTILLYERTSGETRTLISSNTPLSAEGGHVTWLQRDSDSMVNSLAFSPDGARLAMASSDGQITVLLPGENTVQYTIRRHTRPVTDVAFSPSGALLASVSLDGTANLYLASDGSPVGALLADEGPLFSLAFSPDGRYLAVGGNGAAWLWDITQEQPGMLDYQAYPGQQVQAVAFSPNGRLIANAVSDGSVWMRDASDGRVLFRLQDHTARILGVAFSPDGQYFASGGADQMVNLYRISTTPDGLVIAVRLLVLAHADWVNDLAFSPNGDILAVATLGGRGGYLWRIPQGELLSLVLDNSMYMNFLSLAFSPDGSLLAAATGEGGVRIWKDVVP